MRKRFLLSVVLMVVLVSLPSEVAYPAELEPPPFLELPPNARTRALGNGLIGLAKGGSGLFINPGSAPNPESPQVQSLYEPQFDQYSSFSLSFSDNNYGIAYRGIGAGEIIERDLYGQPNGNVFNYHSHGVIGSFGKEFKDFGLGVSAKAFYKSTSDSYFGYSITPGVVYEHAPFQLGAVLPDLLVSEVSTAELGSFSLRKEVKIGVGFSTEPLNLGLDVKAELEKDELEVGIAGAGLEWWLSEIFALRVGTNGKLERSFGFGIKGGNARIDYAYTFHEELPDSYVVSVGWIFG